MSGLEPLALFGLACNVMQVIQFTSETASLCKKSFKTGSPDDGLQQLVDTSAKLHQDLANSIRSASPRTEEETRLLKIAEKTQHAALEVRAEAERIISSPTKGVFVASIVKGVKAKLRENKLDKVEKRLLAYQQLLQSGFLDLVCKKTDALTLQQKTRFSGLDETLRDFIQSSDRGQMRLERLVAAHNDSTKDVVRAENAKSRNNITTTVVAESLSIRQDLGRMIDEMALAPPRWQLREKFLRSLKYETMNDRFEQIGQPHEGTYRWIMLGIRPWVDDGEVVIHQDRDHDHNSPKAEPDCPHETASLGLPWKCFPCWLDSTNPSDKIYWIQGKPGSGKSTLTKFFVSDPGLWSGLMVSKSDPLIISHFFWAAGHQVQRGLRGLLLTMISQFLSVDEAMLDEIIDNFSQAKLKHMHGDWTLRELQEIVERWFARSSRPIFVFLDGLDEADGDEMAHQSLLAFITERLATIKTVKVCLSSRPEPVFKTHLAQIPTLHLQHLTQLDMTRYIHAQLLQTRPSLEGTAELSQIVESLLDMAGGVFLWVALTVKSLCRGLINGDAPQEIHLRLRQMPKGLHSLYQNMWSRLNEDESIYREEAALYINMVLDWPAEGLPGHVQPFHCLMAAQPSKMEAILNDYTVFSAEELDTFCHETAKRIETRTAGLLEVGRGKGKDAESYVGIVHRSALEFFRNTVEGQEILQYDRASLRQRRTRMYQCMVAEMWIRVTGHDLGDGSISQAVFRIALDKMHDAWDKGSIPRDDLLKLIASCKRLYETAKGLNSAPGVLPTLDFTGLAALLGLPHFISATLRCGHSDSPGDSLSVSYRIYLLIAALAARDAWLDAVHYESKSKAVEILTRGYIFGDYTSPEIGVGGDTGVFLATGSQNDDLHLIVLLSIINNHHAWPTSILPLPEAIKYLALRCGSWLEKKVLVVLQRHGMGDRGDDEEFGLSISIFGHRLFGSRALSDMRMWIALEMDVVSLVELLLQAIGADPSDPVNGEKSRDVLYELKSGHFRSFQRHTKIAVFHVPGDMAHYCGLADIKELGLRQAPAEEDHELVKLSLSRIRRNTSSGLPDWATEEYQIPTMTECLRDLKRRSEVTTNLGRFSEIMAENPINKMTEDFMANPPDQYVEEEINGC